jgi:serine/threonine protein kinase
MSVKCPKCGTENTSDSQFCKKCATPLPFSGDLSVTKTLETPTEELTRGTLFAGRYEIIEELGAGGMGLVYRAYDRKMEEEVALKLIRPEISADKRTVERFRNEIKTARKIRHAHVCGMFDLHEENKKLFITMEYVRGEDLKSVIKRMKVLAPGTAVSIARQVAEGLGEAHRLGVVHRDLKPSNVMIDKDGNAKIMDFGIARSLAGGGITAAGAIVGTPEYMSPEQVEGTPADQRADLYALGIMLFEMVTGQPPFEGETPLAIAHMHKYEPPTDPQTLNPQVPKDLSKFILRCLEKVPEKRYQTAEEFLTGLEGVAASLPLAERAATIWPSTKRKTAASKTFTVKITPRKFLIPALALLCLIAGALVIWKLIPKEPVLPYPSDKPSLAV